MNAAPDATPRPQRGDELELSIDSLAFGGEGIARLGDGGYVVFVAGAIPGDRVRAVVHKRKRSYAHARTLEVLEPSPERIAPKADHPGVAWQEEWRYRNKLEYSFGGGDSDPAHPELVCGFHAPAGGNHVTAMEDCLLASERGNQARRVALEWARSQQLIAWERRRIEGARPGREERTGPAGDGRARLRNLVVREGRHTGLLQVRIVTTDGELEAGALAGALSAALGESLSGVLWTRTRSLAETTAGGETELVWGDAELPERLGELDLRISSEAFFQTNTEMAELLYGIVVDYAALEGWERVYDLYSGIGTIALTLAPRAGELWGIELIEPAVADAIAAAKRNEITNVHFFAGDTRLALPELLERYNRERYGDTGTWTVLAGLDDHFELLFSEVGDGDAADLGRL